jgi:hypothetical protein
MPIRTMRRRLARIEAAFAPRSWTDAELFSIVLGRAFSVEQRFALERLLQAREKPGAATIGSLLTPEEWTVLGAHMVAGQLRDQPAGTTLADLLTPEQLMVMEAHMKAAQLKDQPAGATLPDVLKPEERMVVEAYLKAANLKDKPAGLTLDDVLGPYEW